MRLSGLSRKILTSLFGKPSWIARNGDLRSRERLGLVQRPNYLYGMLRAADIAKFFGKKSATVIEFGVASGTGLLNMVALAPLVKEETGINLRIVGFDSGEGLLSVNGYKDHPEIWNPGDFRTDDREQLLRKLADRAEIIWGDIANTVGPFIASVDASAPLGFISVDVDLYSATKAALTCLLSDPSKYNPAVSMYFDDVSFFFANQWAGELCAIREFNEANDLRKIDHDRSLAGRQPAARWHAAMYVCHIFDHEARQKPRPRHELAIGAHYKFLTSQFIV